MVLVHKLSLIRVVLVLLHASVTLAQISCQNKVLTMLGSLGRNTEILVTKINLLNVKSFICLWYMIQIVKHLFVWKKKKVVTYEFFELFFSLLSYFMFAKYKRLPTHFAIF